MTPVLKATRLWRLIQVLFWMFKEITKVRDVIAMVEADGWTVSRQKGSHRQYEHPTKSGIDTVAGQPSDEMDRGTLGNILRVARLEKPKR